MVNSVIRSDGTVLLWFAEPKNTVEMTIDHGEPSTHSGE